MAFEFASRFQASQRSRKVLVQESASAVSSPGDPAPAQNGLRSATRALVPRAAAAIGEDRSARAGARRYRLVQRNLSATAGRGSSVGPAGPQYAAVDAL